MLTLEEFKNRYKTELESEECTENEILYFYDMYLEDPFQFHPDMIG